MRVVLLGDSTFDNGAYAKPSVIEWCRKMDAANQYHLLATDGATMGSVYHQLRRLPPLEASDKVFLSISGNDLLTYKQHLYRMNTADKLMSYISLRSRLFELEYETMLEDVLLVCAPTLCTVYEGDTENYLKLVLTYFNSKIRRVARKADIRVIELQRICNKKEDFIYTIEPSVSGGMKIARAITKRVRES